MPIPGIHFDIPVIVTQGAQRRDFKAFAEITGIFAVVIPFGGGPDMKQPIVAEGYVLRFEEQFIIGNRVGKVFMPAFMPYGIIKILNEVSQDFEF